MGSFLFKNIRDFLKLMIMKLAQFGRAASYAIHH